MKSHWTPQATYCEDYTLISTNFDKDLLLKMTPTQLIDRGEIKLVLTYGIPPYFLASVVQEGTLHGTQRET